MFLVGSPPFFVLVRDIGFEMLSAVARSVDVHFCDKNKKNSPQCGNMNEMCSVLRGVVNLFFACLRTDIFSIDIYL